MDSLKRVKARRSRLRRGIRKKIVGTATKPRLCVFKSNKRIYAQIIDDYKGHTIAYCSTFDHAVKDQVNNLTKTDASFEVGKQLAAKAQEANISEVVFDRNVYLYHGRVKALADGAREGGLNF